MDSIFTRLAADYQRRLQRCSQATIWLVLEGDWGGQIYLTVPFTQVDKTSRIQEVLDLLENIAWPCNEGYGASTYLVDSFRDEEFVRLGIPGGMGGAPLTDKLWLHDEFMGLTTDRVRDLLKL